MLKHRHGHGHTQHHSTQMTNQNEICVSDGGRKSLYSQFLPSEVARTKALVLYWWLLYCFAFFRCCSSSSSSFPWTNADAKAKSTSYHRSCNYNNLTKSIFSIVAYRILYQCLLCCSLLDASKSYPFHGYLLACSQFTWFFSPSHWFLGFIDLYRLFFCHFVVV